MIGSAFREECRRLLGETYPDRLERALELVPAAELWKRPHPDAISFGTILVHLEGNVRQWILSGLGGAADRRERAEEFAAQDGPVGEVLMDRLRRTLEAASDVIADIGDDTLMRPVTIQGFETTPMAALLHVVEHFSWHTGQAVWMAKAGAGEGHGLAFYDESAINAARNA